MMISNVFGQGFDSPHLHFLPRWLFAYIAKCRQQKTLSVADKRHSDCDSLCDADSVPEVIMVLVSDAGSLQGTQHG